MICAECKRSIDSHLDWLLKAVYGERLFFCSKKCYRRFKATEFHK